MQGLSFKGGSYLNLVQLNNFLFVIRIAIRMIDIENTYEELGSGKWAFLILMQSMACVILIDLNLSCVTPTKRNMIFLYSLYVFVLCCMIEGCRKSEDEEKKMSIVEIS